LRIANPIYDSIFKYLLDDEKVARLMLSALIGQEVLSLQFRPTEHRAQKVVDEGTDLLVLHLDFAATVRLEDGRQKLVLIEIQKAHSAVDVLRFRADLGCNYSNDHNVYAGPDGRSQPLPILTIYFLGYGLDGIDAPVLRVNRHYTDVATGDQVQIVHPFVEALTHDCIVVQVNRLRNHRRTDLERLLAVFDQDQACHADPHLLDILEGNFPDRYQEILRRLTRASADQELLDRMGAEDYYLETLKDYAREHADWRKALEEQANAYRKELEARDKALEQQDQSHRQALEEMDQSHRQALAARDRTLEKMQRQIAELLRQRDS
jgi:hypothetical protein